VSRPLIVAVLGSHGPLYPQDELPAADGTAEHAGAPDPDPGEDPDPEERGGGGNGAPPGRPYHVQPAGTGTYRCRYAGAMLTHAFTSAIGAAGILAAGCGLDGADAAAGLAVLNATAMSFTLGALTLEQTKHLAPADAGLVTGLSQLPGLRSWRARLGAIGDQVDPLALQRRMVTALLGHLPPAHQVFLADDHLAEYTGAKPAGWGRNPRRGKNTKGHGDTCMCDLAGRALVSATGEPSGLSLTLPPVLAQLTAARQATPAAGGGGQARPVVVFDRGGSYPKTFTAVHDAGYHWISWRRAPLADTGMLPVCATIRQYGQDRHIAFTDQVIQLDGYPQSARQISLSEHGAIVAQLLTSDLQLCAGALLSLLRARWITGNFLKYNAANYGTGTLADYTADLTDDTPRRQSRLPAGEESRAGRRGRPDRRAGPPRRDARRPRHPRKSQEHHPDPRRPEEDHRLRTRRRRRDRPPQDPPRENPPQPAAPRRAAGDPAPRAPGHHPGNHPARAWRHHHLCPCRHHRHPRPARPAAQGHPRPHLPARQNQPEPAGHPRRPPAHHLPARRHLIIINRSGRPNCLRSEVRASHSSPDWTGWSFQRQEPDRRPVNHLQGETQHH
jgi:hypothetical protein